MPLTNEQASARTLTLDWLAHKHRHILIQGSPGTGKTYATSEALKDALVKIAVACPSHKAKRVAQAYLEDVGLQIDCYTIHALLGLGADISEDGKQEFKSSFGKRPIDNYDFVWVDECSMIDNDLFMALLSCPVSILFTGDKRQLEPVSESKGMPVFKYFERYPNSVVELTEPQRYSGSIKDLVYACIPYIDQGKQFFPGPYLISPDCHLTLDWFEDWKADQNCGLETVILAYTNLEVHKLNRICRNYLLGSPYGLEMDEKLIAYSPINDTDGQKFLPNGTEIVIGEYESSVFMIGSFPIRCYHALTNFSSFQKIRIITEPSEQVNFKKALEAIAIECKEGKRRWSDFYYFKGLVADVRPVHAMTIHKSQGSGFDHVYVLDSFSSMPDKELVSRLYYVASSRAKWTLKMFRSV